MRRYLLISVLWVGCEYNDITDQGISCDQSLKLMIESVSNPSTCSSRDGSFSVVAVGGVSPYAYQSNGTQNTTGLFTGMPNGNFIVVVVDGRGCRDTLEATLNFESALRASAAVGPDSLCLESSGFIEIFPEGGLPPYQFRLGSDDFKNSSVFSSLKAGLYTSEVIDANNCLFVLQVEVLRKPGGVSWSRDIKPIINSKCSVPTCHVPGTSRPDFTNFEKVLEYKNQIKIVTASRTMPPNGTSLSSAEIQLIACWVDDGAPNN